MQQNKSKTSYSILFAIAIAHLFNDLLQAVIPSIYPRLEREFDLSMAQIGIITLCFQLSSSIFQPLVGNYTDKYPKPYSQVFGMLFTSIGIVVLAYAPSYHWVLVAVTLVGIGSSIFHPESSRVAFLASGGKRSIAQSIFQLGGNTGTALAPLLVAWIVIPNGQRHMLWFLVFAIAAKIILFGVGKWRNNELKRSLNAEKKPIVLPDLSKRQIKNSVVILLVLIFSKYFYVSGITSYFQFYTIDKFSLTEVQAQIYLFYFLGAAAVGTLLGGYFGDKFGRKYVIWFSIIGVAPFTLALPYVGLELTALFIVVIGLVISSAFPAILVYAQELLPKKIGMVSGLFYGFAFGMGGLGSAVLGYVADLTSIEYVYKVCSFLPLIGLIAYFLPNLYKKSK
ncbi:MAG TPA: MFS transporter [Flavobacterium sp.]|nr:MFS transporter [Flavobacterium sp.]